MEIKSSILDLIGNTPLIEVNNIIREYNLKSHLLVKVEMFNPSNSIKIRIARKMIIEALKNKSINNETIIIEPTSGNTGIGLALICASLGMKFIAVMPENMTTERRKLIKAYGGKVILTPKEKGMQGAKEEAIRQHSLIKNSFIPSQFENINNPITHEETTGMEIYQQTDGKIDILVSGIGTGGTITGCGKFLKSQKKITIIGVEPASSPLLTEGKTGTHKIQGIGANFVPKTLDASIIDKIITVTDDDAFEKAK